MSVKWFSSLSSFQPSHSPRAAEISLCRLRHVYWRCICLQFTLLRIFWQIQLYWLPSKPNFCHSSTCFRPVTDLCLLIELECVFLLSVNILICHLSGTISIRQIISIQLMYRTFNSQMGFLVSSSQCVFISFVGSNMESSTVPSTWFE